jgi:hypothetical protein
MAVGITSVVLKIMPVRVQQVQFDVSHVIFAYLPFQIIDIFLMELLGI